MFATLENTSGYTQEELDLFNAYLANVLQDAWDNNMIQNEADREEIIKAESDKYLTSPATSWPDYWPLTTSMANAMYLGERVYGEYAERCGVDFTDALGNVSSMLSSNFDSVEGFLIALGVNDELAIIEARQHFDLAPLE